MELGLILQVVKLSLEIFKDSKKDKFLKEYMSIQMEYSNEMSKGLGGRSDLAIDRLYYRASVLAKAVVKESQVTN